MTGEGRVEGTPDTLRATVGVEVTRGSVGQALSDANAAASDVTDALLDERVDEANIQTRELTVEPRYEEVEQGRGQVTGYTVRNLVEVTLTDLERVGEVLDAAVRAGGDAARLQGVRFSLEDNVELLDAAREDAFEAARAKAAQYAQLASRDLGDVVNITESGPRPPTPVAEADAASASIPVQPGTQQVTVAVTVTFALGGAASD